MPVPDWQVTSGLPAPQATGRVSDSLLLTFQCPLGFPLLGQKSGCASVSFDADQVTPKLHLQVRLLKGFDQGIQHDRVLLQVKVN